MDPLSHLRSSTPSGVSLINRGELAALRLSGALGSFEVAAQGAHLLSWEPAGHRPVIFMSPRVIYKTGKAIRGGVPICFPWFGPKPGDPTAASHGFARNRPWEAVSAHVASDGTASAELRLTDNPSTRTLWPHAFDARFRVKAGATLDFALDVHNTGDSALQFEAALHTYLAVSDVRRVLLRGLEGAAFLDRVGGASIPSRQPNSPLTFASETNRTYHGTTATCMIGDSAWARCITIKKSGSKTTVVWNPWTDTARTFADLGEDGWPGMLCVESAAIAPDAVTLAPGAHHALTVTISVANL